MTPTIPLAPFHKDEVGNCFNSNHVRTTFPLGYTYPEIQPWDTQNKENGKLNSKKWITNIRAALTALYDLNTPTFLSKQVSSQITSARVPQQAAPEIALVAAEEATALEASEEAAPEVSEEIAPEAQAALSDPPPPEANEVTHDDYIVNVLYDK